jgi:predicted  nucleic acid-binding Zn-ribbon protein
MAKQKKGIIDFRARDINNSVLAVGTEAMASKNAADDRAELHEAKLLLADLRDRLSDVQEHIENRQEIQDEVDAVRNELDRERPRFKRVRSALEGIKSSLGPAETLARIAAQVLDIVKQHG